jgi:tRNA(Ile)-lysidine synthase
MSAESFDARFRAGLGGLSPRKRLLVAVSGGRDSMVLLHSLLAARFKHLVVVHFNHQLRGRSSAADARFVKAAAGRAGLQCILGAEDVRGFARGKKLSIETAARQLRYEFFKKAARTTRCRTLLLGHHADDQVETFLFNLLRGTGLRGLAGMQPASDRAGLTLLRPMLGIWRAEIDEFARTRRVRYREDVTNAETESARNKLRHRIIPWISAEFGRDVRNSLWRAAQIAAADEAFLEAAVPMPDHELSVTQLRALPLALQRRLLLRWFRAEGVSGVGFDAVESARSLLSPGAVVSKLNLPGALHVRRRSGKLFIEAAPPLRAEHD